MPALATALPLGGLFVKIVVVGTVALAAGKVAGAIIAKANKIINLQMEV